MNLDALFLITEDFRKKLIGDPVWVISKGIFEYKANDIKVVVALKIIRAVHSLKSMILLGQNGLLIDMQTIYRCIHDCCYEVHFLLENYPKTSPHVEQFIKAFFETTIDMKLDGGTNSVESQKIHSAAARAFADFEMRHEIGRKLKKIHKTFSGYIHSNYAHIMQNFGGREGEQSFNLGGIPSLNERAKQLQTAEAAYDSVVIAIKLAALKLEMPATVNEINQLR